MKILIICPFPPRKSPEADHAFYLAKHLASRGLDLDVLTHRGSISDHNPRLRIHPLIKNWSWVDLPQVKRTVQRCSPDAVLLIYTRGVYDGHPMVTFIPTVCKRLLPRARFVTLFEDAPTVPNRANTWTASAIRAVRKGIDLIRSLLRRPRLLASTVRMGAALWAGHKDLDSMYGTLLRDSDCLIVVSERARVGLAARLSAVNHKSVLIPPPPLMRMLPEDDGSARQRCRQSLGLKPADIVFVYFGYIYSGKGVETLLEAFRIVSASRSDVRLLMVGGDIESRNASSYIRKIRSMATELGIAEMVKWTGEYDSESGEASGYLRAADICVLPFDAGVSLHNSSFAAAAAHGLPVITTRGETLEQPFIHEKNVFLCHPEDPNAMALAMAAVMDNSGLKQHLRCGILELAREWYSWETAIERTIATFNDLSPHTEERRPLDARLQTKVRLAPD
jgi:polysaccharide biosynthesis protein PslF